MVERGTLDPGAATGTPAMAWWAEADTLLAGDIADGNEEEEEEEEREGEEEDEAGEEVDHTLTMALRWMNS